MRMLIAGNCHIDAGNRKSTGGSGGHTTGLVACHCSSQDFRARLNLITPGLKILSMILRS